MCQLQDLRSTLTGMRIIECRHFGSRLLHLSVRTASCLQPIETSRNKRFRTAAPMEQLEDMAKAAQRAVLAAKQKEKRQSRANVLPDGLQKILAMLVLLGAHWDCIRAMVSVKADKLKVTSVDGKALSTEEIQKLAKSYCDKNPAFPHTADNHEDAFQMQVSKLWRQWRTGQWLFLQNLKGISMPPSLVMEHYRSMWGHGPHGPRVTKHLDEFQSKAYKRQWMSRFRKLWGYQYSKMPASAPMTDEMKKQKACSDKPAARSAQSSSGVSLRIWGPTSGTKLGSTFGTAYAGPMQKSIVMAKKWFQIWVPKNGSRFWNHF